jgi:uncharacterized membrane protein YgcG
MPRISQLLISALFALPATALAQEQFVLFDVSYSHDAETTSDSHYVVEPSAETPDNWRSPVDYAAAKVEMYLEVKTKPSDAPTRFQLCFIGTPSYACTDQSPVYTETGVVKWTSEFENFYQYSQVDWSKPLNEYTLILKDDKNGKPAPENVGEQASTRYFPTHLRVVATLVPEGAIYTPPDAMQPGTGGSGGVGAGGQGGGSGVSGGGGVAGAAAGNAPVVTSGGMAQTAGTGGMPQGSGGGFTAAPAAPPPANSDGGCRMSNAKTSALAPVLGLGLLLALRLRRRAA